jgi:hypothetical protein
MRYLIFLLLCNCASFPPLTVGAGFMGATVDISTPGWSAPVPVKPSAAVEKPVLMVPLNTVDAPKTATINGTASKPPSVVPVIKAPVTAPVLAVPVKLHSV